MFAQTPRVWSLAEIDAGNPGGCWGVTIGRGWCGRRTVSGKLTCKLHSRCEEEAQRMLAEIRQCHLEAKVHDAIPAEDCGDMVVLWAGSWHLAKVSPQRVQSACGAIWLRGLTPARFEFRRSAVGVKMCRVCAKNQSALFGRVVYRPWDLLEPKSKKEGVGDGYA
jgi:hypothetical protein